MLVEVFCWTQEFDLGGGSGSGAGDLAIWGRGKLGAMYLADNSNGKLRWAL